jgi:hypothetical protein
MQAFAPVTGDLFDPASPEPVPCVLETAPERFALGPGLNFLYGFPEEAVKTWLLYFGMLQELERGNRTLLIDYELSFERAMRRMHVLAALRGIPLDKGSRCLSGWATASLTGSPGMPDGRG